MAKVAAYFFLYPGPNHGEWVRSTRRATREHIDRLHGATLFNTKMEVEEEEIDRDGMHRPPPRR